MAKPQNLDNHVRIVRGYITALILLLINLIWTIARLAARPSWEAGETALLAVALFLIAGYARRFALTVQDRVIRLEMRLRLQEVLPPEMRPRIAELSLAQMIALRFASNAELPALTAKVLDEGYRSKPAIKALIRDWQPDELRA